MTLRRREISKRDRQGEINYDPKYARFRQAALLTGVPLLLVAGPVCGYFIGRFLDQKWGTDPGLMILFIVMGGIAGVREMVNLIKRLSNDG